MDIIRKAYTGQWGSLMTHYTAYTNLKDVPYKYMVVDALVLDIIDLIIAQLVRRARG